jgi:hypothetical protein
MARVPRAVPPASVEQRKGRGVTRVGGELLAGETGGAEGRDLDELDALDASSGLMAAIPS